ncbi:MAG: hypothetical protein Q7S74_04085 [Nanoarchaeota archaeon]|nr:hypothetical protein [Nanoarchaeota archaeon]
MKLKMQNKVYFWLGIGLLVFLILAYFIKVPVESGQEYYEVSSNIGIIIFYNHFIIGIYILIGIVLIVLGLRKNK